MRVKLKDLALAIAIGVGSVATWKMLEFHDRLTAIADNERWEERLQKAGVYEGGTILFFGDSQIALWPMAQSFGVLPIRNRGSGGDLAADAGTRFNGAIEETHPRLTVLLIGTNDLGNHRPLDETMAHIEAMLSKASGGTVIVCSLLPVAGEYRQNHPQQDIARWNGRLRELARAHQDPYVDLYSLLADQRGEFRADLTRDGLHPNDAGYVVMSLALLPGIR